MQRIHLNIKASITLCLLLGVMTAIAVLSISVLPYPWQPKAWLAGAVLLASGHAQLHHALRGLRSSVVAVQITSDSSVQLLRRDGRCYAVKVLPSTVVTPWLSVLHCQVQGAPWYNRVQHAIIFADAVDADAYRHLRVYLRWAQLPD